MQKNACPAGKRSAQAVGRRNRIPLLPTALYFLPLLFLLACYKTEYSSNLTEPATVVDLIYVPSNHGSGLGIGIGSSPQGGVVTTVAPISVDIPEKYAVVFRCTHGKFIIENQNKAKELWNRLKVNQDVTVSYREVYRVEYKDERIISKHLIKYEFLDAR